MSIDHGVLNVPLHKRGDIDAELDRYKRQQSLLAKQQAAVYSEARKRDAVDRKEAERLIAALPEERVAELAGQFSIPKRSVRKRLREMASLYPAIALKAMQKEVA